MNGLTYVAPALAAMRHCTLEKHSVTFVLMPSVARLRTATMPASVIGILTTMLSAILASPLPSRTMPSVSRPTTSAETGPSTSEQISFSTSRGSRSPACLDSSEGLVVMPSISPACVAQLMSLRLAVSRKNFMTWTPRRRGPVDSAPLPDTDPGAGQADWPPDYRSPQANGGNLPAGAGRARYQPWCRR